LAEKCSSTRYRKVPSFVLLDQLEMFSDSMVDLMKVYFSYPERLAYLQEYNPFLNYHPPLSQPRWRQHWFIYHSVRKVYRSDRWASFGWSRRKNKNS